MSIHVTPIPRLIDLAAPSFTLGTTNAAGSAVTAVASDSTLLAFDATLPDAITLGQSGAVGTATVTSRRDHAHAMESVTLQTVVWCQVQSDGTSLDSYNVASTAKDSTGIYTVTIDNDLANTYYVGTGSSNSSICKVVNINTKGVGSYKLECVDVSESAIDTATSSIICGELA